MTRFKGEEWGISPSAGLCVFDIGSAKIGIAICYNSEFPLIARALAESGAEILIVPSCAEVWRDIIASGTLAPPARLKTKSTSSNRRQ